MAYRRTRKGGKSRRRSARRGGDFLGLGNAFTNFSNTVGNYGRAFGKKAKGLASGVENVGSTAVSNVETTTKKVVGGRTRRRQRGGMGCSAVQQPHSGGRKTRHHKKRHHKKRH